MALARYIYSCAEEFAWATWRGCVAGHLDGPELAHNLTKNIQHFKLNESAQGDEALALVYEQIYFLGNQTGICSPANTSHHNNGQLGVPLGFREFFKRGVSAMFQAFDLDIPQEDQQFYGFRVAAHSWRVVYTYFWAAIILLFICLTMSSLLADKGTVRFRRFRWAALSSRAIIILFSIIALTLGLGNYNFMYDYLRSMWVLPTVVIEFSIVCIGDRISRARRKNRESKLFWSLPPDDEKQKEDVTESEVESTNAYGYRMSRAF